MLHANGFTNLHTHTELCRSKRDLATHSDISSLKCRKATWAFSHTWVSNTLFKSVLNAEALSLVLAELTTWSRPILQAVLGEDTSISVWSLHWRQGSTMFFFYTEKIKCRQSYYWLFVWYISKTKRAVKIVSHWLPWFTLQYTLLEYWCPPCLRSCSLVS